MTKIPVMATPSDFANEGDKLQFLDIVYGGGSDTTYQTIK